jgi:hypothetical protein
MADKVIKEHYVPQRYLKHFSSGNKFFVYDKERKQQRPGNIRDYACERYFYDVDFDTLKEEVLEEHPEFVFESEMEEVIRNIDKQHIEHWFGQNVETWLFNPIDRIITSYMMCNPQKIDSVSVLTDMEMNYLSLYMATQVVRSKEFRESMSEIHERRPLLLMKKRAKAQEEKNAIDSIELKIKSENHKKLLHAQFLMDPDLMADFAIPFREKIWMIGCNQTDISFFASDNPIVKFGHQGKQGFNSKGIEIFFPLSTKIILILKDPETFWYENEFHNHFVKVTPDEVEFYNSLQVQQSYRYIFDKAGDFALVHNMMKRNPALSDIKHKRFLMG